jgi:hypothetical protein
MYFFTAGLTQTFALQHEVHLDLVCSPAALQASAATAIPSEVRSKHFFMLTLLSCLFSFRAHYIKLIFLLQR